MSTTHIFRSVHPLTRTQYQKWVSYNTSKSAVKQMGRSMACELAAQRIRVNTLSPGYIYTTWAIPSPSPYVPLTSSVALG